MQKFTLCKQCARRFKKGPNIFAVQSPSACHACLGAMGRILQMAQLALRDAVGLEWETFSVASSFPRSLFVRENEIADFSQPGEFTSLKNSANSQLAAEIESLSGKKSSAQTPDLRFSFDFSSGKAAASPYPLYLFGHYLKLSRRHCQSRWHCGECRGSGKNRGRNNQGAGSSAPQAIQSSNVCGSCGGSGRNYPSIEDELSSVFKPAFLAEDCVLHASGREDVDVRTLGNGRPFVMEIKLPKRRKAGLQELEARLSRNESVRAVGLRMVGPHFIDAVCGSHFEKAYSALIFADRPLTNQDAQALGRLSGIKISQHTPKRVLSRRADMERTRRIVRLSASCAPGGALRIDLLAEAGTYIKELVSGDGGRTRPSVSQILSCNAICTELDVSGIRDYFLETVAP